MQESQETRGRDNKIVKRKRREARDRDERKRREKETRERDERKETREKRQYESLIFDLKNSRDC